MDRNQDLYHDEVDSLKKFRTKIDTHAIYKEDLEAFSSEYEELIAQIMVITRISDRLQKRLDKANFQIRARNEEINDKNIQLADTVDQLAKAKVSKRASTIVTTLAIILFIVEQIFIEPIIEKYINIPYVGFGVLGLFFFIIKFLEGQLEKYFMRQEKQKIIKRKN